MCGQAAQGGLAGQPEHRAREAPALPKPPSNKRFLFSSPSPCEPCGTRGPKSQLLWFPGREAKEGWDIVVTAVPQMKWVPLKNNGVVSMGVSISEAPR